jgi:hypothetical protein
MGDEPGSQVGEAGSDRPAGFEPDVVVRLRSYVFLLVDPRTGRPFAVGRGKGDKCYRTLAALRNGSGDPQVVDRVRKIEAGGRQVRVDVLRYGLTGEQARLVEAAAADALGLAGHPDGQRVTADALRSALSRPAKFKRAHQVVLLRLSPSDLGSVARHRWRIGRRWTDVGSPRAPKWAVIVVDDLVRAVCSIDGWEATGDPASPATRYILLGRSDPEMERRYVGRSVAAYRTTGSPSPVTYVWCGPHWVNRPG